MFGVLVRGVAQRVSIDRGAVGIAQQPELDWPLSVRLDLLDELATRLGIFTADRVENGFTEIEITEPGYLPGTVRSPVATIESEDDWLAAGVGERHGLAGVIGEREIWCGLADLWRIGRILR